MDTILLTPVLRSEIDLHRLVGAGRGLQARAMRGSFARLAGAIRPAIRGLAPRRAAGASSAVGLLAMALAAAAAVPSAQADTGAGSRDPIIEIAGLRSLVAAGMGTERDLRIDLEDTREAGAAMLQALENSPAGVLVEWESPSTGSGGTIVPVRSWTRADGTECRAFAHEVKTRGLDLHGRGTACRNDRGRWEIRS